MIQTIISRGGWILMPEFSASNAIVLGSKPLGENSFIVSLFTPDHGRHLGVVKKKHPPEIGTLCQAVWKARLADQLGTFYLEETKLYAPLLLDDIARLHVLSNLCALLDKALPERQIYADLHAASLNFLETLSETNFYEQYVLFEVKLLAALGFALDMTDCAGGGDKNDLAYISPKTGRAVSREKGRPYHNKLLKLPRFLWQKVNASSEDLIDGLTLTGHFLQDYLGSLPAARTNLYIDIQRRQNG